MKRWAEIIYFSLILTECCVAQPRSAELVSSSQRFTQADVHIRIIEKLTENERTFYWKDKIATANGYIRASPSQDFTHLIDSFFRRPLSPPKADAERALLTKIPPALSLLGVDAESYDRRSVPFMWFGRRGVISESDFRGPNDQLYVVRELINQDVGVYGGTLIFVAPRKEKKGGMWKFAWATHEHNYEVYLDDDGHSTENYKESVNFILSLARAISETP